MKLHKKIVLFVQGFLIVCILISNTKIHILATPNINYDYRKINNVAVLLSELNSSYLSEFKHNLESIEEANKNKIKLTFYDEGNNPKKQYETIDLVTKSNFDLIIALLVDSTEDSVKDFILKAKNKNIPLILIGINPKVTKKISNLYHRVAFVSFNPAEAGIAQGHIVVNTWKENQNIMDKNKDGVLQYILLKGVYVSDIANERSKSSISTINDSGIKTEEIQLIYCDWSRELAKNSIQNVILKYDGNIEAIISNNDEMAIGALEGIQKYGYNTANKLKYIPIFGIDGSPEAIALVDKGLLAGTVIRNTKDFAEGLYSVGMNLINNLNPIENTKYKLEDNQINILTTPIEYTKENIFKQEIS